MPYVTVKKGPDSHVWTFTVHAADGDQLDEGTVDSTECWWPLRLLPGPLRDRLCRDQHSPTPPEINRFLTDRGWHIEFWSVPRSQTVIDADDEFACPRCGGYARVDCDPSMWLQPDRIHELPAACVGHDSCGWTGTRAGLRYAARD